MKMYFAKPQKGKGQRIDEISVWQCLITNLFILICTFFVLNV